MTRRFGLLLTVVGAMLLACTGMVLAQSDEGIQDAEKTDSSLSPQEGATEGSVIPNRYIVVLDEDATEAAEQETQEVSQDPVQAAEQATASVAEELAQENDLEVTHTYGSALEGFAAEIPEENLDDVRSDPRVDYIAEDRKLSASAQLLPTGVNRADADISSVAAGDGSGTVDTDIAVLDTGIYPHPDLNLRGGYNCTSTAETAWGDGNGHGTHVAGSAAAKDDSVGVVGTAPGARLWAIKVLDKNGDGSDSTVMCGVNYVTSTKEDSNLDNDIEVVNMSLSGRCGSAVDCDYTNNDPLHASIRKSVAKGITYAVAAGNEGDNAAKYFPAAYDEVITVSALTDYNGRSNGGAPATCTRVGPDDNFASFNNFGPDVDIGAPGACITSTWKPVRQAYKKRVKKDGRYRRVTRYRWVTGYNTISGTSMASPHVAGAAAVYLANENPGAIPEEVKEFLTDAANSEAVGQGHTANVTNHPEPVLQMDNY